MNVILCFKTVYGDLLYEQVFFETISDEEFENFISIFSRNLKMKFVVVLDIDGILNKKLSKNY